MKKCQYVFDSQIALQLSMLAKPIALKHLTSISIQGCSIRRAVVHSALPMPNRRREQKRDHWFRD